MADNNNNHSLSNTSIWTPSPSPKDHRRINQQYKYQQRQRRSSWLAAHGFGNRTTREHLEFFLLLASVILAVASIVLSILQNQAAANSTTMQNQATATAQQRQTDLDMAKDQQEGTALQAYLAQMSNFLLAGHLAISRPDTEVRKSAQALTLALLPELKGTRKAKVIRFLYEEKLLGDIQEGKLAIVSLQGMDLSQVDLSGADLYGADLSGANLTKANLSKAKLIGASLTNADLTGAIFADADLTEADLSWARGLTSQQLDGALLSETIMPDGRVCQSAPVTAADSYCGWS